MVDIHIIIMNAMLNFNFTNLTSEGLIRVAFNPYLAIFGNLFWGIVFGFVGASIFVNERSLGSISAYLIVVGVFFAVAFPTSIIMVFGLLLSFSIAVILYKALIERREY